MTEKIAQEYKDPCLEKRKGEQCILANRHPPVRRYFDDSKDHPEYWEHISEKYYWRGTTTLKRSKKTQTGSSNLTQGKVYQIVEE